MAPHNAVLRTLGASSEARGDPQDPRAARVAEGPTTDGVCDTLTLLLETGGCRLAQRGDSPVCEAGGTRLGPQDISQDDLLAQVEAGLAQEAAVRDEPAPRVRLATTGNLLDQREVPPPTRAAIANHLADRDRLVLCSAPEFVTPETLDPFTDAAGAVDVALELETASDRIRRDCLHREFEFDAYEAACGVARECGAGVVTTLRLKPPFLTEGEAITDCCRSTERAAATAGCHTVTLLPQIVQRDTVVDALYRAGGYRPPWLWAVHEVLRRTAGTDARVFTELLGEGTDRGPHNCGKCDGRAARAVTDFNRRQDPSVFDQVSCQCERTWQAVCERERGYVQPLH
jgi:radical SAM enzyme (TIGR01210 family)